MENTPTRLSPAAQTVLDSFLGTDNIINDRRYLYTETKALADALRAAADLVAPPLDVKPQEDLESRREAMKWGMNSQTQLTRHQLLAIATELERHYDSLYS